MIRSSVAAVSALVLVVWLAACSPGEGTGTASPPTPAASTPTDSPSPPATASTSTSPTADATDAALPPVASLVVEGADPVPGELGGYTWAGGGSDAPWLPGTPVTVAAGEPMSIALADGAAIESWVARRVPADAVGSADAVPVGEGTGPVALVAPEAGDWSLQVMIVYVGGGSAAWYWAIDAT